MTNINIARLCKKYGVSESFVEDVFEYISDFGVNDKSILLALTMEYGTCGFDKSVSKDFIDAYKKCN